MELLVEGPDEDTAPCRDACQQRASWWYHEGTNPLRMSGSDQPDDAASTLPIVIAPDDPGVSRAEQPILTLRPPIAPPSLRPRPLESLVTVSRPQQSAAPGEMPGSGGGHWRTFGDHGRGNSRPVPGPPPTEPPVVGVSGQHVAPNIEGDGVDDTFGHRRVGSECRRVCNQARTSAPGVHRQLIRQCWFAGARVWSGKQHSQQMTEPMNSRVAASLMFQWTPLSAPHLFAGAWLTRVPPPARTSLRI